MFVLYDKERPEDGDDWLKNGALLIRLIKIDINKVLLTVNKWYFVEILFVLFSIVEKRNSFILVFYLES